MKLLSNQQFLFAVLGGGLAGLGVAAAIGLALVDRTVDASELFVGAWIGFALTCAMMMIKNANPPRSPH